MKKRKVIIYGNSLFLAGIAASLAHHPALTLCVINSAQPNALEAVARARPDVVMCGLDAAGSLDQWHVVFDGKPWPVFVVLDVNSSPVIVLSGQSRRVRSAADLAGLIQELR